MIVVTCARTSHTHAHSHQNPQNKPTNQQIRYFKHNDMADLERVLKAVAEEDRRLRRNTLEQRRFIAVGGVGWMDGERGRVVVLFGLVWFGFVGSQVNVLAWTAHRIIIIKPNNRPTMQVEGLYKHFGDLCPLRELVRFYIYQTCPFHFVYIDHVFRIYTSFVYDSIPPTPPPRLMILPPFQTTFHPPPQKS